MKPTYKYRNPPLPGQALPPTFSHILDKGSYSVGMGESIAIGRSVTPAVRAGASDFLLVHSFGNST